MQINLDSDVLNADFPSDLVLPSCPNQSNKWTFWRIYSAEIYTKLVKHVDKFRGHYLSRISLGELFYERINDDNVEFDHTVQFQAVQIVKIHDPFRNRLTMDAMVVATADNLDVSQAERTRKIYAVDSLAELLKDVVEEQDYMLIFGQNSLVNCETIALNSRMQELVLIAVYRHNGVFCPEYEGNSDNIIIRFDGDKFRYLVQEQDDDEGLMKIEPRSTRPAIVFPAVLNGMQETSNDKVMRFLDKVSPQEQNRSDCSTGTSPLKNGDDNPKSVPSKETLKQRRTSTISDSIGDYHLDVMQCFDSDSDSSSTNMGSDDHHTSKSPQSLVDVNELNGSESGSSIAQHSDHNTVIHLSNRQPSTTKAQNVSTTRRSSPTFHLQQVIMADEVVQEQQQDGQTSENKNSFTEREEIYEQLFAEIEQEVEEANSRKRRLALAPQESDTHVQNFGSPKENHISKGYNSTGSMCSQRDSSSKLRLEKNSSHNHEVENVPPSPTHQPSNPFLNMNDATQIHYSLDSSTWLQEQGIVNAASTPASPEVSEPDVMEKDDNDSLAKLYKLKPCYVRVEKLQISTSKSNIIFATVPTRLKSTSSTPISSNPTVLLKRIQSPKSTSVLPSDPTRLSRLRPRRSASMMQADTSRILDQTPSTRRGRSRKILGS